MVLSHGHYDHFGGMVGFLRETQGKRKPKLPLYIAGEECFCSRQFTAAGPTPLNFSALDRKAIAEADLVVTTAEGPAVIADHAFVTGHIPRATFERVLSPTRMKVGIDNGLGCFPDKMPPDRRPIDWAPDEFDHEISICVNVKGRGLLVMTSCRHRGVVNAVKQAMAVSGLQKVHAVLSPQAKHLFRTSFVVGFCRRAQTSAGIKAGDLPCGGALRGADGGIWR
jgi:7,8-dihydropterin-6-yl-methyl-4-(beta-D-ribofuranosyl)aminobenzene 5'-phosphate synthase